MSQTMNAFIPSFSRSSTFTQKGFGGRYDRASVCDLHETQTSFHAPACPKWTMKVGILYSTVTSSSEKYARMISDKLGEKETDLADIAEISPDSISQYEALIVGAPTLNTGADEQRTGTPWDQFLINDIDKVNLDDKPVAVFGHGDATEYAKYFCDSIEQLHDQFEKHGSKMIGYTDPNSINFEQSKAVRNGRFLGLPLDVSAPSDQAEQRISDWCAQIISEAAL